MGMFDKLKFWKHEDEFDFNSSVNSHMGSTPGLGDTGMPQQDDLGLGEKSPFEPNAPGAMSGTDPFDANMPPPSNNFDTPHPSSNTAYNKQQPQTSGTNRDIELLSSKLDTIKALLSSLDQRMAHLERAAGTGKKQERLW
jgi:hypothetical protein